VVEALTAPAPGSSGRREAPGITIDLGFAFLEENGVRFGFVDVPGHERFVSHTSIPGAPVAMFADEALVPGTSTKEAHTVFFPECKTRSMVIPRPSLRPGDPVLAGQRFDQR